MSDLRYLRGMDIRYRKPLGDGMEFGGWIITFEGWIDADAPGQEWAKELPTEGTAPPILLGWERTE